MRSEILVLLGGLALVVGATQNHQVPVARLLELASAALPGEAPHGVTACDWEGAVGRNDRGLGAAVASAAADGLGLSDCRAGGLDRGAYLWLEAKTLAELELLAKEHFNLTSESWGLQAPPEVMGGYPMVVQECERVRLAVLVIGSNDTAMYEVERRTGELIKKCQCGAGANSHLEGCREALDDSNVCGETMTVAYDFWENMWSLDGRGSGDSFVGIMHDVLQIAADRLNVTLDIRANVDPSNGWGLPDKHGNWTGLAGMLQRGEVDVVGVGMEPTLQRSTIIDFSHSIITFRSALFVRRPTAGRVSWQNYFYEFDLGSWTLVAVTALGLLAGFYSIIKREGGCGAHSSICKASSIVLRSLVYKGTEVMCKSVSMRLLLLVALLFSTIVLSSYKASMNAFLAVVIPVMDVNSLEDIPGNKAGLAFWAGTTYEIDFQEAPQDSTMGKLYQDFLSDPQAQITNYGDGLHRVIDQDYAMLAETIAIYNMANGPDDLHCKVTSVPNFTYRKMENAFGFPRSSRFVGPINKEIIRMKCEGVVDRLIDKYFWRSEPPSREGSICRAGAGTPLGAANVIMPFLLLTTGAAAASVLLAVEWMIPKKRPRSRSVRSPVAALAARSMLLTALAVLEEAGVTDEEMRRLLWEVFQRKRFCS